MIKYSQEGVCYKFINIFVTSLLIFCNNQDIKTNHFETENRFALNFSFGY
jgi:hypothetical protein